LRPDGNFHIDIFTVFAVSTIAGSVTASASPILLLVTKRKESVQMRRSDKVNVPALSAISPARTTSGNVLLATKRETPIAPITSPDVYFCLVDKHWRLVLA